MRRKWNMNKSQLITCQKIFFSIGGLYKGFLLTVSVKKMETQTTPANDIFISLSYIFPDIYAIQWILILRCGFALSNCTVNLKAASCIQQHQCHSVLLKPNTRKQCCVENKVLHRPKALLCFISYVNTCSAPLPSVCFCKAKPNQRKPCMTQGQT